MTATIHANDRFAPEAAQNDDCPQDEAAHTAHPHREQFPFTYLPDEVRVVFEEALQCYSADLFNAFALTCRNTAARSMQALHDAPARQWHEAFEEIVRIGEVDNPAAQTIEQLLFGEESAVPMIDAALAAVLLEVVKDVLYQCHVRAAKFRAAMRVRRFFAEEQSASLTTLRHPRGAKLAG